MTSPLPKAGAILATLTSPVLLLVVIVLVLAALVAVVMIVVVVLTAARTRNRVRHAQSIAVLDRLLALQGRPAPPPAADLP